MRSELLWDYHQGVGARILLLGHENITKQFETNGGRLLV